MADSRALYNGLANYHQALETHLQELTSEYQKMEETWYRFSAIYDGDAANQFRANWMRTINTFQEYISQTDQISRLLEERITALSEADCSEGVLDQINTANKNIFTSSSKTYAKNDAKTWFEIPIKRTDIHLLNQGSINQNLRDNAHTLYRIAPVLLNIYFENIQSTYGAEMRRFGKVDAEPMAAKILQQIGYLDRSKKPHITNSRGVDITGETITGVTVIIEVKFSTQEKDFGQMMNQGAYADTEYPSGRRQMSDIWLKRVAPNINFNRSNILGVHINPIQGVVTIYRRMDSEAKYWKPLITKSLSDFDL